MVSHHLLTWSSARSSRGARAGQDSWVKCLVPGMVMNCCGLAAQMRRITPRALDGRVFPTVLHTDTPDIYYTENHATGFRCALTVF